MNTDEELVKKLHLISELHCALDIGYTLCYDDSPSVQYFKQFPSMETEQQIKDTKILVTEVDKLLALKDEDVKRCEVLALQESGRIAKYIDQSQRPTTSVYDGAKERPGFRRLCFMRGVLRRMGPRDVSNSNEGLKRMLKRIHPNITYIEDLELNFTITRVPSELQHFLRTMFDAYRSQTDFMNYQVPYVQTYVEFVDKWCTKYPQLWQHATAYWRDKDTPIPMVPINEQIVFEL